MAGSWFVFLGNNYDRALQWATDKKERGRIKEPAVIGAVLQLGYCCDFLEQRYIRFLARYHGSMKERHEMAGKELPRNNDLSHDIHKNKVLRHLDCAAIEFMHARILEQVKEDTTEKGYSNYKLFDSTRGVFIEGGPAFEGAGLFEKSHIQICIRNPNCIQGFFMPREEVDFMDWLECNHDITNKGQNG